MGNTILIIGNGFDLYHRRPTRYTDFLTFVNEWKKFKQTYDSYKDDTGMVVQEGISPTEQFIVRLDDYGRLTADSVQDFSNHAICYDPDNIQYLDDTLVDNAWIQYFLQTDYKKEGWIDFEREMEKVLHYIEKYYTELLPRMEGKIPNIILDKQISRVIRLFGDKANLPFKNLNGTTVHRDDLSSEIMQKQKLALLEAMKIEMNSLNKCLYIYLAEFVSRIKCTVYSEQIKNLMNVHLLNFNYTYTYHSVYGKTQLIEHHPIHGELRSDDLVLGISDDAFVSLDYVYFQKYFQRIQKRTGSYYRNWIPQAMTSLEDDRATVHIMGHSLDVTDAGILKHIFWDKYVKEINIYYHNQTGYESQVINLIKMFGKEFVIDQTANERILFIKLEEAKEL